jgi:Mrp family chromosome partitioning ATPase
VKSLRLGDLLEAARGRYDYVVLDTPPLVPVPDCRLIGKWIDGFLVVVAAHKTPRKLVEEGLNVLDSAKVLGLVFNEDNHPLSGYYDRPYHRIVESKPAPGWRFPWPPRRQRRPKTRASEQWR